jgi:hypothetical protein
VLRLWLALQAQRLVLRLEPALLSQVLRLGQWLELVLLWRPWRLRQELLWQVQRLVLQLELVLLCLVLQLAQRLEQELLWQEQLKLRQRLL